MSEENLKKTRDRFNKNIKELSKSYDLIYESLQTINPTSKLNSISNIKEALINLKSKIEVLLNITESSANSYFVSSVVELRRIKTALDNILNPVKNQAKPPVKNQAKPPVKNQAKPPNLNILRTLTNNKLYTNGLRKFPNKNIITKNGKNFKYIFTLPDGTCGYHAIAYYLSNYLAPFLKKRPDQLLNSKFFTTNYSSKVESRVFNGFLLREIVINALTILINKSNLTNEDNELLFIISVHEDVINKNININQKIELIINKIKKNEWIDQSIIQIIAILFNVNINIYSSQSKIITQYVMAELRRNLDPRRIINLNYTGDHYDLLIDTSVWKNTPNNQRLNLLKYTEFIKKLLK
jgi:hypothetical protein